MAVNWLPAVQLTASARPVFLGDEVERHLVPAVDLVPEENPELPPLLSGLLFVTSHRIIWIDDRSPHDGGRRGFAIPLSAVVHAFPRKKSLRSMFANPRIGIQVKTTPDGRVADGGATRSDLVVTVVLRGKTDPDVFYGRLLEVLRARSWETAATPSPSGTAESAARRDGMVSARETVAVKMPVIGVAGILKKEQEQWESTDKSLQEAFQDLNALMSKAKEMVQLAERLRQKLLSSPNTPVNANDEDMGSKQEMQDWLLSVGIASPVTKESAGALYHQQLSREDKFESDEMDMHKENIVDHMKALWNKWRGSMHIKYLKGKTIADAVKNIPDGIEKRDWEWLVKEFYHSKSFKESSERNAKNKAKMSMPHRSGSMPIREIIYQQAEIQELVRLEPTLTPIEVVERCFGFQNRSHVVGFGGGIKAKDLRGTNSKSALLNELRATR